MILPGLLVLALIGGRPEAPTDALVMEPDAGWSPSGRIGPEIRRTSDGGWRFAFPAGTAPEAGYALLPAPGNRIAEWGATELEIEFRGDGGEGAVDVVLVTARTALRSRLSLSSTSWQTVALTRRDFRGQERTTSPLGDLRPRFFRFEAPESGFSEPATLEVRRLAFRRDDPPPRAPIASRSVVSRRPVGVEVVDGRLFRHGEPWFPFGSFLLGGNRSLLEEIARAGANVTLEYGPASWSLPAVEDHLDFARHCGVSLVVNLATKLHDRYEISDERLRPLGGHDAFFAWYLLDEPDGARFRGLDAGRASPERLRERREALRPDPVLITCLNAFGLADYARTADIFSTDYYWPAYAPQHSPAVIASKAESVAELAAEHGAAPLLVLQLGDPQWTAPEELQTPASLRAQALGALAGGVRGLLLFQAVSPRRWHEEGLARGEIWDAFLRLAEEASTWGPLVARWERMPGMLHVEPALGEVYASCFEEAGDRWLVLVNLGRTDADVTLSGPCLDGVESLHDPFDGWRARVRDGRWSGRLKSFEGRVVRVGPEDPGARRSVVEARLPPPDTLAPVRYDRALLGVTIYPAADEGSVRLWLDGQPRSARVRRGAATSVRFAQPSVEDGAHEVHLAWAEDGVSRESTWSFRVDATSLPWEDTFDREDLGEHWTAVEDVRWNTFDPAAELARGRATVRDGALVLESTGGDYGVVLRRVEAPPAFRLTLLVDRERAGTILVQRNELFRRVETPAGRSELVWVETPQEQTVAIDGEVTGRWTPALDHRGGVIGLGVGAGETARFDRVRLEVP